MTSNFFNNFLQVLWTHKSHIFCGGSIYNQNTIITAGHCCAPFEGNNFDNPYGDDLLWKDTKIIAAELVYSWNTTGLLEQARSVKSHKIHPDYDISDPATPVNDICLLELDSDLDFNGNVPAIELNTNEIILDPTSTCTLAGWGKTQVST